MRSYRTKQIFFAVVVIIAMSTKPAWSAELIPLRATYASIGGAFAPLWLAQDKGLFNKYGLAVDLKYMSLRHRHPGFALRQRRYRQSCHRAGRSGPGRRARRFYHRHPQSCRALRLQQTGAETARRPARQNLRRHAAGLDHRSDGSDTAYTDGIDAGQRRASDASPGHARYHHRPDSRENRRRHRVRADDGESQGKPDSKS